MNKSDFPAVDQVIGNVCFKEICPLISKPMSLTLRHASNRGLIRQKFCFL